MNANKKIHRIWQRANTYLATPVCILTTSRSRFDELQEGLRDILDVHPRIDVGSAAMVESCPRLDARPVQRRVVNAINTTGPGAPAVNDGRAHDRGLQCLPMRLPGLLDQNLGVAVDRLVRHGPDGIDVVDIRPHLGVQLAEVFPLRDDARAAEVDVEGRERGGRARGDACEEGADCGLVV